ncbi:SirB1 family protein [Sphingomonas sp. CCH5-D11]|uniref:SirB1 family protein n=1 Tax=Sphingomonas sp. CCH5-D11 TaxID=1768786 RepID=UPI0008317BD1|nr:transglutaminase-like domain-containing protein [Sphingomonas sp. CCH5-D11]
MSSSVPSPTPSPLDDDLIRLGLVEDQEIVLDEAALALALLDRPEVDLDPYHRTLEEIADSLALAAGETMVAADQAEALSAVLAQEFGFLGDEETYDDPDNADLIRVMDRRRGLPVSLSILYVAAARRLGWHAQVLDVPGHVLVLIGMDEAPVIIDPFAGGARVGAERLAALLQAHSPAEEPVTQVSAMPNRAVLIRLLQNQASRAEQAGRGRRALTLYERMTAMAPEYAHAWWQRARLELVDGDVTTARSSLGTILEITREPKLRSRVSQMLEMLPPP